MIKYKQGSKKTCFMESIRKMEKSRWGEIETIGFLVV
jgi:hypothetical protein